MAIIKHIPKKGTITDRRKPEGGYYEAKCEVCGTIFYPSRSNAKYCSNPCAVSAHRKRKLEGTLKPKAKVKKPIGRPKVVKNKAKTSKPKPISTEFNPYIYGEKRRTLEQWELILTSWRDKDIISKEEATVTYYMLKDLAQSESFILKGFTITMYNGLYYSK